MSIPAFLQTSKLSSSPNRNPSSSGIEKCITQNALPAHDPRSKFLNLPLSVFKSVWASVMQIPPPKAQLSVLCEAIARLLNMLLEAPVEGNDADGNWEEASGYLESLLEDISSSMQRQSTFNFVQTLFARDKTSRMIGAYFERWQTAVDLFQLSDDIDTEKYWSPRIQQALAEDRSTADARLKEFEVQQNLLHDALNLNDNNALSMMAAFQKRIDDHTGREAEQSFFKHCMRYISNYTGRQPEVDSWTITAYDVEFRAKIGSGGFGTVCEGRWWDMPVALKVLNSDKHVAPQIQAVRREIETWSKLQHPNILEFFGANILDDRPFIVMPFLKNGNARDYIQKHPNLPRLPIVQQISQGLSYLHSQHIIHGDLKATNILISDDARTALLCDFGLSRLKQDVNTRTADDSPIFVGSQNWMAPELFRGRSLKFPCDVYSFGMTVYEIYTMETPLGTIPTMEALRSLVVDEDVRPEKPEPYEAPQLTEEVWKLAQRCWVKDPAERPTAAAVFESLNSPAAKTQGPAEVQKEGRRSTVTSGTKKEKQKDKQKTELEPLQPTPNRRPEPPQKDVQRSLSRKSSLMNRMFRRRKSASESNVEVLAPPPIPEAEAETEGPAIPRPRNGDHAPSGHQRSSSTRSSFLRRLSFVPESPSTVSRNPSAPTTATQSSSNSNPPPLLVFTRPYSRCMSLDHPRNVTVVSLTEGGRYLAVGLEVTHVEIWDLNTGRAVRFSKIKFGLTDRIIPQPSEAELVRLGVNSNTSADTEPIKCVDLRDTFAGRFLVYTTEDKIVVRDSMDMNRRLATEWDGMMNCASEVDGVMDVQFKGGIYCDAVAIVDMKHAIRTVERYRGVKDKIKPYGQSYNNVNKPKESKAPAVKLMGVADDDRTCFLWPKKCDYIFVGISGGDILVHNADSGQEASTPLIYGQKQVERTVAALGGSRQYQAGGAMQDGLAGEEAVYEEQGGPPVDCCSMAYNPTGKKLVACYKNGEIRIWNLKTRTYILLRRPQKLLGIEQSLLPIAFSPLPTENVVVYPSLIEEKTLIYQDFNTGVVLANTFLPDAPRNAIKDIVVSPDKKKRRVIVTFEEYPAVKVWCWD